MITGLETVLGAHDAAVSDPQTLAREKAAPVARDAVPAAPASSRPSVPKTASTAGVSTATGTGAETSRIVDSIKHEEVYLFRAKDATELASARSASDGWNDDIDYGVTQRDAMLMQSSLAKKTKTLTSGTLMTQKMRDEERRRKLASLPCARIRIEFFGSAGDQLVVQLDLPAAATIMDVYAVVHSKVLESPTAFTFKLYDCAPPRRALEPTSSVSVYEAGLWPAARLAVDSLERSGQRVDLTEERALEDVFAASLLRRKGVIPAPRAGTVSAVPAVPTAVVAATAPVSGTSKSGGVPKWFKK
jgi:hypothetical protein